MSIVYVNGNYEPASQASVSIYDRGFLFADGVYDVCAVLDGKLIDYAGHMDRLKRSLSELSIPCPVNDEDLLAAHRKLAADNDLREGLIYIQITRGASGARDFLFDEDITPTVVMFTSPAEIIGSSKAQHGGSAVTVPDIRWARRDIKSIALLPQILARMEADRCGATCAIMVQDGYITEEAFSNTHIVKDGTLITRPLSNDILPGVTRKAILSLLDQSDVILDERPFSLEELYAADEVFVTSATWFVTGITQIDGKTIAHGKVGPVSQKLRDLYIGFARQTAL